MRCTGLKKWRPTTRSGQRARNFHERQRGSVRREHGVVAHAPLEFREEPLFEIEPLDRRLDHEIGGFHRHGDFRGNKSIHRRARVDGRHQPAPLRVRAERGGAL
jgi:hypothetical protein